jgi:lipoprotein-anchoring transpeptidase ErfK/SrfK
LGVEPKIDYFTGVRAGGWDLMMKHLAAICLLLLGMARHGPALARPLAMADVNAAEFSTTQTSKKRAVLLKAQVLLDRAGFSPGAIDARAGSNFANALRAFQQHHELAASSTLDAPTWSKLTEGASDAVLIEYVITADDVKGPFAEEIPDSFEKKAALKRLGYTGAAELLAERFHMDEDLLEDLNPKKELDKPGTTIVVANVKQAPPKLQVTRIVVEKGKRTLRAFDPEGRLVGFYPASIGSDERPPPSGTLKITRVVHNPFYVYDPRFRFDGVNAKTRLKIAPGPNNPVGSVWMNLNERSYGIHGTAEPSKIGKTYSHGCVRLTNWDARRLAAMVKKGTTVEFVE